MLARPSPFEYEGEPYQPHIWDDDGWWFVTFTNNDGGVEPRLKLLKETYETEEEALDRALEAFCEHRER